MADNNNWLSALPMVGSIANAIGNIGTARKNRRFTREENERQRQWSTQQWERQNQASIDFWKMQNAYNDPAAQMERLKNAGLNPNLVYGSGADATAGPISTHSASQPRTSAEKATNAVGGSIFDFLNVKQAQANIARTEAETKAVETKTAGTAFDNKVKQLFGVERMVQRQERELSMLKTRDRKAMADLDVYLASGFLPNTARNDPKNPAVIAARAGYDSAVQALQNARKLGDIRQFESIVKKFEARLAKQGIPRDSGIWSKILLQILLNGGVSFSDPTEKFLLQNEK